VTDFLDEESFFDVRRLFEIGIPDFLLPPIFEVRPESYEFLRRDVTAGSAEWASRADLVDLADGLPLLRPLLIGGSGELRPVGGAELNGVDDNQVIDHEAIITLFLIQRLD
jgi:hypothetical protein